MYPYSHKKLLQIKSLLLAGALVLTLGGAKKEEEKEEINWAALTTSCLDQERKLNENPILLMSREEDKISPLLALLHLEDFILEVEPKNEYNSLEYSHALTYEEKMKIIMNREALTYEELDVSIATFVSEAAGAGTCYIDAYGTSSTGFNRLNSFRFTRNRDLTIYDIVTSPGQFEQYWNGNYKEFLGRIDLPGYQACIDMLYYQIPIHDALYFVGASHNVKNAEQLVANGNYYTRDIKEEDRIDPEIRADKEQVLKLIS